ncbi:MAG: peptidylprolyl isomerase [Gemmatimonadaceae bacterium]|nr:peptidylprolyl isomerase [Gemmatimonadaceae bacterium]
MTRSARLALAATLLVTGACHRVSAHAALFSPTDAALAKVGPDSFDVEMTTTKGSFVVRTRRDWAPKGADRFHYLVRAGYYDGVRFFRVVDGFVAQFGMAADPKLTAAWRERRFTDDSVRVTNQRGTITFATGGPNTRTTQLFINFKDNSRLDRQGFSPIGQVVRGMSVVDSLHKGYGEGPPRGQGPSQGKIASEGEAYLAKEFPKLDKLVTARVVQEWRAKR